MFHNLPKNLLYESPIDREKKENIEFAQKNPPPNDISVLLSYDWPIHMNWGDWYLDEKNYYLDLLPDCHFGKWSQEEPLYSIDLKKICSANDMLKWFFQLSGKDPDLYGRNVIIDLYYAFKEIFADDIIPLTIVGKTICPTAAVSMHIHKYELQHQL